MKSPGSLIYSCLDVIIDETLSLLTYDEESVDHIQERWSYIKRMSPNYIRYSYQILANSKIKFNIHLQLMALSPKLIIHRTIQNNYECMSRDINANHIKHHYLYLQQTVPTLSEFLKINNSLDYHLQTGVFEISCRDVPFYSPNYPTVKISDLLLKCKVIKKLTIESYHCDEYLEIAVSCKYIEEIKLSRWPSDCCIIKNVIGIDVGRKVTENILNYVNLSEGDPSPELTESLDMILSEAEIPWPMLKKISFTDVDYSNQYIVGLKLISAGVAALCFTMLKNLQEFQNCFKRMANDVSLNTNLSLRKQIKHILRAERILFFELPLALDLGLLEDNQYILEAGFSKIDESMDIFNNKIDNQHVTHTFYGLKMFYSAFFDNIQFLNKLIYIELSLTVDFFSINKILQVVSLAKRLETLRLNIVMNSLFPEDDSQQFIPFQGTIKHLIIVRYKNFSTLACIDVPFLLILKSFPRIKTCVIKTDIEMLENNLMRNVLRCKDLENLILIAPEQEKNKFIFNEQKLRDSTGKMILAMKNLSANVPKDLNLHYVCSNSFVPCASERSYLRSTGWTMSLNNKFNFPGFSRTIADQLYHHW